MNCKTDPEWYCNSTKTETERLRLTACVFPNREKKWDFHTETVTELIRLDWHVSGDYIVPGSDPHHQTTRASTAAEGPVPMSCYFHQTLEYNPKNLIYSTDQVSQSHSRESQTDVEVKSTRGHSEVLINNTHLF